MSSSSKGTTEMTSTLLTGTPEIPVPISPSSTIGKNKT